MLRLLHAARNTWLGLCAAARSEQAFRQEVVVLVLAVPLAFFLAKDAGRWLALVGIILLVMVVELLNTAIEKLSDQVAPHRDDAIGRIKDMGSAAVGLSLLIAGLVWLLAIGERLGLL